jgi:hypothetical protein
MLHEIDLRRRGRSFVPLDQRRLWRIDYVHDLHGWRRLHRYRYLLPTDDLLSGANRDVPRWLRREDHLRPSRVKRLKLLKQTKPGVP